MEDKKSQDQAGCLPCLSPHDHGHSLQELLAYLDPQKIVGMDNYGPMYEKVILQEADLQFYLA